MKKSIILLIFFYGVAHGTEIDATCWSSNLGMQLLRKHSPVLISVTDADPLPDGVYHNVTRAKQIRRRSRVPVPAVR